MDKMVNFKKNDEKIKLIVENIILIKNKLNLNNNRLITNKNK